MSRLNDAKLAAEPANQPLSTEEQLLQATARAMDVVFGDPIAYVDSRGTMGFTGIAWEAEEKDYQRLYDLDSNGLPRYPECEVGENTEQTGGPFTHG